MIFTQYFQNIAKALKDGNRQEAEQHYKNLKNHVKQERDDCLRHYRIPGNSDNYEQLERLHRRVCFPLWDRVTRKHLRAIEELHDDPVKMKAIMESAQKHLDAHEWEVFHANVIYTIRRCGAAAGCIPPM